MVTSILILGIGILLKLNLFIVIAAMDSIDFLKNYITYKRIQQYKL